MTGPIHAPSYNAGLDAVGGLLRTLGDRIIRADLGLRQKQLLLGMVDQMIADLPALRIPPPAAPADPVAPEPGPEAPGPGGASAAAPAMVAA